MLEDFYTGPETVYLEAKHCFKLKTQREFGPIFSDKSEAKALES
jgi:hypothetical protein